MARAIRVNNKRFLVYTIHTFSSALNIPLTVNYNVHNVRDDDISFIRISGVICNRLYFC